MHEAVLPDVDADVIHARAADLEEQEIAAPQLARRHGLRRIPLLPGGARQGEAELAMRVEQEAAAAETGGRCAAVAIARPAQRHGERHDRVAAIADGGPPAAAIPFSV